MEPANSESERMMRIVLRRKTRHGISGAAVFSTPLTCMPAWKKLGLNVSDIIPASIRRGYRYGKKPRTVK